MALLQGEHGLVCLHSHTQFSVLSLFFPQCFRPVIYGTAQSHSQCTRLIFPLGSSSAEVRELGCGALLSSLSSNLARHLAGSEIVLFFVINLSVPQYPFWEKSKYWGWTQFGKAIWELCIAVWCYTSLGISTSLPVNAFVPIQQLYLEGGSDAGVSARK